jgi:periplasmic divalent cation tolerance protein
MDDHIIMLTTLPDEHAARALAQALISEQLAACINIMPRMTSIYSWKGKLEEGQEHLLIIKTRSERYTAIEQAIKNQHPYELPEIIATPISHGLPEYLNWIDENTQ